MVERHYDCWGCDKSKGVPMGELDTIKYYNLKFQDSDMWMCDPDGENQLHPAAEKGLVRAYLESLDRIGNLRKEANALEAKVQEQDVRLKSVLGLLLDVNGTIATEVSNLQKGCKRKRGN